MTHEKSTSIVIRLALAASGEGRAAPEWIMLLPAGRIKTTDGRVFRNEAPDALVDEFRRDGLDLPIDINHRSEVAAPGEDAPAVGWIKDLQVRDGQLWARVEWTPRGEQLLAAREYRYISPAFWHAEDGLVLKVLSAALLTQPAIPMPALAARQKSHDATDKETGMNRNALCKLLGLSGDADDTAITAAIEDLKAQKAMAGRITDPDKWVPRADYDQVRAELAAAQKTVAGIKVAELKAAAERLVENGVKEGKIAPASRDFWLGLASQDAGGLEKVRAFLASAPQIAPPGASLTGADADAGRKALTAAEKKVAAALGIGEAEFLEMKETD